MTYKIDYSIDINAHSSHSHILKNIKPNSLVLEIGSGFGRMTKYMKEQLGCKVVIVESSLNDFQYASLYARFAFSKSIEDIKLLTHLVDSFYKQFDYVIYADVLEHLRDPESVVKQLNLTLKNDGSIFISVPNISHNSVIIDLINDKFSYRDFGLLDSTHIKFFTENSLDDFTKGCNLICVNKYDTYNQVENTEFSNSYLDIDSQIAEKLKLRKNDITYQFVREYKYFSLDDD